MSAAASEQQYDEKHRKLTQTPISRLIPTLAIPTIISMLISSIYNMADTFFVSQLGREASGAVSIIFSLMALIQTVGFTFAMGSGNNVSRALGRKDRDLAERILSTGFFTIAFLGVMITIFGLMFIDELVYILGATDTIAPYAKEYARYILLAAPFMASSFVMNNVLRSQGNAFNAMLGITTGGILNIILDPLFIFGIGPFPELGIAGAAIATGISQAVSFCILFYQCNFRANTITIDIRKFSFKLDMYQRIVKAGLPTFFRQGLASIASILLNTIANPYGDVVIASAGIVNRVLMFMNQALMGYGQGFQPVAGFNYGAKRFDRVLEAFWFSCKVAFVVLTSLGLFAFIFADDIISVFRPGDTEVIAFASAMLRFNCLVLPIQAWYMMSNMLAQSIGYSYRAALMAMSKQGIFFIPVLLILPQFLGATAIQIAQPIADCMACLLASTVIFSVIKDLNRLKKDYNLPDSPLKHEVI